MEQMHTDDQGSDEKENIFQVQFQAVAVDFPGGELGEMSPYAITAGIEYGHGEYVWIGQMEVVTDIAVTVRQSHYGIVMNMLFNNLLPTKNRIMTMSSSSTHRLRMLRTRSKRVAANSSLSRPP